jgi:hypothetical protein
MAKQLGPSSWVQEERPASAFADLPTRRFFGSWVPHVRPLQAGLHGFIKKLSEFAGISASLIESNLHKAKLGPVEAR